MDDDLLLLIISISVGYATVFGNPFQSEKQAFAAPITGLTLPGELARVTALSRPEAGRGNHALVAEGYAVRVAAGCPAVAWAARSTSFSAWSSSSSWRVTIGLPRAAA